MGEGIDGGECQHPESASTREWLSALELSGVTMRHLALAGAHPPEEYLWRPGRSRPEPCGPRAAPHRRGRQEALQQRERGGAHLAPTRGPRGGKPCHTTVWEPRGNGRDRPDAQERRKQGGAATPQTHPPAPAGGSGAPPGRPPTGAPGGSNRALSSVVFGTSFLAPRISRSGQT